MFTVKLLCCVSILFITLIVGIASPLYQERLLKTRLLEAFAFGIFLGIALLHMLPNAYTSLGSASLFIACATFILLLALYKLPDFMPLEITPYILTLTIGIHALLAGGSLGINQTLKPTITLFVAIIAHKGSESFALANQLALSRNLSKTKKWILFITFACMTPIGILLADRYYLALSIHQLIAYVNAIAAGTLLFIASCHRISIKKPYDLINFIVGLCAMGLI